MSSPDTAAPVVLRPHGASAICLLVWILLAGLTVEAVYSAGLVGLFIVPGLALVAAVIWALLWAPRLVLLPEGVQVRNLLHSYRLPFARIEKVRLGAMVGFDVDELRGRPRRVTAWNAPGIGRDNPLQKAGERTDALHPAPYGAAQRTARRRRLSSAERMRRDQAASRSAVVRERWEDWHSQHPQGGDEPATRAPNLGVLAVLGLVVLANLALRLL